MNYNQAVYTTKYIIEDKLPILYVIKDENGDWQFLGGQDVSIDDLMIVSLKQIIDYDKSINTLLNLKNSSFEAKRNDDKDKWKVMI